MGQRRKCTNASFRYQAASTLMLCNLREAFEWAHEYLTEFLTLRSSEQFHKKATT
jgi:hypothetical protein